MRGGCGYAASTRRNPFQSAVLPRCQHRQDARVLVVAVEGDPRQRGEMLGVFGEDHARPRRHRGLEAGGARQWEFARARRDPVAIGIGEMRDGPLQHAFNSRAAGRHIVAGGGLGLLGEMPWRDGVRADGDQRIGGERLQLVPGHAELAADRGLVDAVACAKRGDLALDIMLVRQGAQPVVQPVEGGLLAAGVWYRGGRLTPLMSTAIEEALAITVSSATHHSRPVPSAKSLAT